MNRQELKERADELETSLAQYVSYLERVRKLRADLNDGRITEKEAVRCWLELTLERGEQGLADMRGHLTKLREATRG